MTSLKIKAFWPLGFLTIVVIITVICVEHYAKKEVKQKISFVVARIYITPALRCNVYDKSEKELKLNSYTFYENSGLKVGDSIVKHSNSSIVFCYRKNTVGEYKIVKEFQPD